MFGTSTVLDWTIVSNETGPIFTDEVRSMYSYFMIKSIKMIKDYSLSFFNFFLECIICLFADLLGQVFGL